MTDCRIPPCSNADKTCTIFGLKPEDLTHEELLNAFCYLSEQCEKANRKLNKYSEVIIKAQVKELNVLIGESD